MPTGDNNNNSWVATTLSEQYIGMGGVDTVDYSAATSAIFIDFLNNTVASGDILAQGDTFDQMENIIGGSGADFIRGNSAINYFIGGIGDDLLEGRGGADTLDGGTGSDTASYESSLQGVFVNLNLTGSQSSTFYNSTILNGDANGDMLISIENILGSSFADYLMGNSGVNVINGGNGNDTIIGGAGADILTGGAGVDTVSYENATGAVTVRLSWTTAQGNFNDASGDVLSGFENLTGSNFNDRLFGDSNSNILTGGLGNDMLEGGAGADILYGGDGAGDTASYADSMQAVQVNLNLQGVAQVSGGFANGDILYDIENLAGSNGNDTLVGNQNNNQLTGGLGNDVLEGGMGADHLVGSLGIDTAVYTNSQEAVNVSLIAGAVNTGGDAAGDTFSQVENLIGSTYNDILIGDALNNVFEGGVGADQIDGNVGVDTASYASSVQGVTVDLNLAGISQTSAGDANGDILLNIENLLGSAQVDTLTGNSGNNVIEGGASGDIIDGGLGIDTASYATSNTGVTVSLVAGAINTGGHALNDVLIGIENLLGSVHADSLTGDSNNNIIEGGAGGDQLNGGSGIDTVTYANSTAGVTVSLVAGATNTGGHAAGDVLSNFENVIGSVLVDNITGDSNNNVIDGGGGGDIINGGGGIDTVTYATSTAGVTVNLGIISSQVSLGTASGDKLSNIENLVGSSFADTFTGNGLDNVIEGGLGADIINGAGSNLNGDTVSYAGSSTGVVVTLGINGIAQTQTTNNGDASGDIISNIENISGSVFNDTLNGNNLNNILEGGLGADILNGGEGIDTASYANSAQGVTIILGANGAATTQTSNGEASNDVLTSIENLIGSAFSDTFTANNVANNIAGGNGSDTVSYANSSAGVTVNLNLTTAQVSSGDASGDVLTSIENIVGSAGNDTLTGNASDNIFYLGLGGTDIVNGGLGNDTVIFGAVNSNNGVNINLSNINTSNITNVENILVSGTQFSDTLTGDSSNNLIEGLGGSDILNGAEGVDTVSYASSSLAVSVDLGASNGVQSQTYNNILNGVVNGDAAGDVLSNFENVIGSAFDDILIGSGTNVVNTLNGGDGNDILQGRGGADILIGGSGNDTASYSLSQSPVTVSLVAGATNTGGDAAGDVLTGIENLIGSSGADSLTGDSGNNIFEGLGGSDTINGGLSGVDTASYASSSVGVTVDLRLTSAQSSSGHASGDTLISIENLIGSNTAADTLIGSNGNVVNTIDGGGGNDIIQGLGGADILIGGLGQDTVSYADSDQGVTVDISLSTAQISTGHASGDVLNGFEHIIGSAHDDVLIANIGENDIFGGDGNDILMGGEGSDELNGQGGNDTASYLSSNTAVSVYISVGAQSNTFNATQNGLIVGGPQVVNGAAGDLLSSIENLTGSLYNDQLFGDTGANILNGSDGDDLLVGNAGADILIGGSGSDIASYSTTSTGVVANLFNSANNTGHAAGDTYNSIENLMGSTGGDTLTGNNQDNIIWGNSGIDTLYGLDGNDILDGGAGNDSLYGDGGIDTVSYLTANSFVTVTLTDNLISTASGGSGNDNLFSIENITGSNFNDTLTGNSQDNLIQGLGGADTINGGAGIDTVSYEQANTGVTVDLGWTGGQISVGSHAHGDILSNVENLIGSDFADTLQDKATEDNVLDGGDGNDILISNGGNDTLIGGQGSDTYIVGLNLDDLLVSGSDEVTVTGFEIGVDNLQIYSAYEGTITLSSNANNDTVVSLTQTDGVNTHTTNITLSGININDFTPDMVTSL